MKKIFFPILLLLGVCSTAQQLVVSQFNAGVMTEGTLIGVTGEVFNRTLSVTNQSIKESILHLFTVQNSLGITEVNNKQIVRAFPNPVKGLLYLELQDISNFNVHVYSILGVKINQLKLKNNQLDFSNLSNGIYILSVESKIDQNVTNLKIIKN